MLKRREQSVIAMRAMLYSTLRARCSEREHASILFPPDRHPSDSLSADCPEQLDFAAMPCFAGDAEAAAASRGHYAS